jgi:hypothetical protein
VISVNYHGSNAPSGYLGCGGGQSISVSLNNTTFCSTTTYTSNFFTSLGTTTYWLSYDGNYVQIFHSGSSNQATRSGSCQTCNSTPATATPLPATATPLPATATPLPPTAEPTLEPTPTPEPDPATPTPLPPTQEPTATPVPATSYKYQLGPSYTTTSQACSNFGMDFYIEAFAATDLIYNVTQFFTDSGLTTAYTGENETHSFQLMDGFNLVGSRYSGTISYSGQVSDRAFCTEQN